MPRAKGELIADELRHRIDSVLASSGLHRATNALGVLFGLIACASPPDYR